MSETPETDAMCICTLHKSFKATGGVVTPDFARRLERERDEWKAKFIKQNKDLGCEMMDPAGTIWDYASGLQRENVQLKREVINWKTAHDIAIEQRDRALTKIENQAERIKCLEGATNHATGTPLSKLSEQRDRLAEALREIAEGSPCLECGGGFAMWLAEKALAAVKGGSDE